MKKLIFSKFFFVFLISIGTVIYVWKQENRLKILEIYALSLKNGNAAFIRTPNDKRIIINGGSNSEIIRHISKILPFYSRRIDIAMVTDTQKKNVAGLVGILERYKVDQLVVPALTLKSLNLASSTDSSYVELLKVARQKKVSIREIGESEKVVIDSDKVLGETVLNILFPSSTDEFNYSKASSPEIVFKLSYKGTSIISLGDSSKKIQNYINSQYQSDKPIDVLIINQGAVWANISRNFIEKLKPNYFIYSQVTSKSPEVIFVPFERRFNAKEKTVKIISNGKSVEVSNLKF